MIYILKKQECTLCQVKSKEYIVVHYTKVKREQSTILNFIYNDDVDIWLDERIRFRDKKSFN